MPQQLRGPNHSYWIAAGAIAGVLYAAYVFAAPRAESAMECGIAADMAIVARSLAEEEVQPQKADAVMTRIYDVSQSERGKELMKDILEAAYRSDGPGQAFAEQVFSTCMKTGGDMNTILGKRS
jgi:hypothetical protein